MKLRSQVSGIPPMFLSSSWDAQSVSTCDSVTSCASEPSSGRPDGRKDHEARRCQIRFQQGKVTIHMGKTCVACTTYASKGLPTDERPNEGFLSVQILYCSATCLPHIGDHDDIDDAHSIALRKILLKCGTVDLKSLCIKEGHQVWKVRLEIRVYYDDAAAFDCCVLAAAASLKNFERTHLLGTKVNHSMTPISTRLRTVADIMEENNFEYQAPEAPRSLGETERMHDVIIKKTCPIYITFALMYQNEDAPPRILLDPLIEELVGEKIKCLSVVCDGSGNVMRCKRAEEVASRELEMCCSIAKMRAREVCEQISAAVA